MVVNSPEVRDDTIQLFSEPLPSGAGPGTSHSMAVPSAEGTIVIVCYYNTEEIIAAKDKTCGNRDSDDRHTVAPIVARHKNSKLCRAANLYIIVHLCLLCFFLLYIVCVFYVYCIRLMCMDRCRSCRTRNQFKSA